MERSTSARSHESIGDRRPLQALVLGLSMNIIEVDLYGISPNDPTEGLDILESRRDRCGSFLKLILEQL